MIDRSALSASWIELEITLQLMKFVAALVHRRQRFAIVPVQMDLIRPMLKRVAAAERSGARPQYKLRPN
jgi:hypothetical protein